MVERTKDPARVHVAYLERQIERYKAASEVLGLSPDSVLKSRVEQTIRGMRYIQAGLLVATGELSLVEALKSLDIPGLMSSAEKIRRQGGING